MVVYFIPGGLNHTTWSMKVFTTVRFMERNISIPSIHSPGHPSMPPSSHSAPLGSPGVYLSNLQVKSKPWKGRQSITGPQIDKHLHILTLLGSIQNPVTFQWGSPPSVIHSTFTSPFRQWGFLHKFCWPMVSLYSAVEKFSWKPHETEQQETHQNVGDSVNLSDLISLDAEK